jgi:DNA-binding HxlR family transcriptional regulator
MTEKEQYFQEKINAIQDAMFVIGGKWKMPIILSIYQGNKRFNEILNSIPKITNRVLSKELKHLEENLLIDRNVIDGYPVKVEYIINDYGLSLQEIALPLEKWGRNHNLKIRKK